MTQTNTMPLVIHPRLENLLLEEQTQAVYKGAIQAFLKLELAWAACPHQT